MKLTSLQKQIFNNFQFLYNDIAKILDKNEQLYMRNIKKLKDHKKLERAGSDKTAKWKII